MPPVHEYKSPARTQCVVVTDESSSYRQDPPNAIQIELVEGCSLNCRFCGVQGIRDRKGDYSLMTRETMMVFCDRLFKDMTIGKPTWNPRLELAMHGEPTVHPQLVEMVRMLGQLKPRVLGLVSNGTGLIKDPNTIIPALFAAGLTSICLDQYDGCDFVPRILERYTGDVPIIKYTGVKDQKFWSSQHKGPFIVVKGDVSHIESPYDRVNTHCGGGGPPSPVNPALYKRCAKPFRELAIRWDGNVALCCNDFRGIYKVANIRDHATLDELWQHPRLDAARRVLYHGSREFVPCKWCDAISPRVGLLPDKYGKVKLPMLTEQGHVHMNEAIAGRPYTEPVLRGWEVGGEPCLPGHLVELGLGRLQPLDRQASAGTGG